MVFINIPFFSPELSCYSGGEQNKSSSQKNPPEVVPKLQTIWALLMKN